MKLLFVTPQVPFPPHKGTTIRNFHLLKNLAQRHDLTLLTYTDQETPVDLAELSSFCSRIETVPRPCRSPLARMRDLPVPGRPDLVQRLRSHDMLDRLRVMIEGQRFDLVQMEGLEVTGQWPALATSLDGSKPRVCLDEHNAEYLLQRRAHEIDRCRPTRWVGAIYSLLQWRKLARYERQFCRIMDGIIAVSDHDRTALWALDRRLRVGVVPNGVDTAHFQPDPRQQQDGLRVVFTGTMDFRPNVDGVQWFCSSIWPRVRAQVPEATFFIVGRDPRPAVSRLAQAHGVVVTGGVSDVRPYLAAASVAVVPLRIGGGSRLKVLEAMAAGVPIVSTSIGCEGIAVGPDSAVIADEPVALAHAIVHLLRNPEQRWRQASAARSLVVGSYDWRAIVPRLEAFHEEVLGQ